MKKKWNPNAGVGQPSTFALNLFGDLVDQAFDDIPFLVGSATQTKKWRDVDVRLILDDKKWDALGFGDPKSPNKKWAVTCMAFAALGKQMTGLPIDFQIQQMSHANMIFTGPREALFWIYRTIPSEKAL